MLDILNSKFFTEQVLNNNENIKQILYFLIMLSIIALIYGSLQSKLTNLTGIILSILMAFFIYNFFQKKYKKKFKMAGKKFKQISKSHLLTKICNSKLRKNKICQQHENATNNYNKINDMLLKQYK